jgi:predicted alpha/beta hydrolase family esterase
VILVAHSAGVLMVAAWAQNPTRAIRGALLVTPADVEKPLPAGYPGYDDLVANGWVPIPRAPLPFPSLVVASRNDPLAVFDRVASLAGCWGSTLHDAGEVGHLNPAAGYGPWSEGRALLRELERMAA